MQTGYTQFIPKSDRYKRKIHFTGEKSKRGLIYTVRNCFFEPSEDKDALNNCLKQIGKSFSKNNPAIICSHRVNYMSGISADNSEKNLLLLDNLISDIMKKWPDVKFMTSIDLLEMMKK